MSATIITPGWSPMGSVSQDLELLCAVYLNLPPSLYALSQQCVQVRGWSGGQGRHSRDRMGSRADSASSILFVQHTVLGTPDWINTSTQQSAPAPSSQAPPPNQVGKGGEEIMQRIQCCLQNINDYLRCVVHDRAQPQWVPLLSDLCAPHTFVHWIIHWCPG